jgi:predicted DNA-binding ribbon-helix-helix protein
LLPAANPSYLTGMKSLVRKRSVLIAGRQSSISVEDDFWFALQEIAKDRDQTVNQLVTGIETKRNQANLSSAVGCLCLIIIGGQEEIDDRFCELAHSWIDAFAGGIADRLREPDGHGMNAWRCVRPVGHHLQLSDGLPDGGHSRSSGRRSIRPQRCCGHPPALADRQYLRVQRFGARWQQLRSSGNPLIARTYERSKLITGFLQAGSACQRCWLAYGRIV